MAIVINAGTINGSSVRYPQVGGLHSSATWTTEAGAQWRIPRDGTLQNGEVQVSVNSLSGDEGAATLRVKVNGANTPMAVTIPAGATGRFQIPGTVAVLKGDLADVEVTAGGSGENGIQLASSYEFVPAS